MMRRFLLCMVVAQLLGIGTLLNPSDAWAQGRGRSAKTAKAKKAAGKKSSPKAPPKIETKGAPVTDPVTGEPDATASSAPPPQRGPSRIDFDDRLIQGQTNKSGAVYLYDRKELKTRSMIRERDSFRAETLATVYDQ
ncbi:hypothetical protein SAMN05443572_1011307 [Myxococcus fulvus]|uniref:Uncharacterized protein n=2 Tax=Myxococcus fulvus TaxID=33 RepID=A0ABY1BYQ2_MYXFU|nr:hypothetical protein [Myxococcus fulvus]AKF84961.1 hypothetical protein MFUL124B02_07445 [Myxococcus fulvus 124B02]SET16699.1 hypothetical protein SAMN05443572_1011307 [Myxococcus fulvus]